MKKLILSCLLMLCAGTMMATEPAIFAKASGSSTCYLLSKTPQVTIADGKATLTVDSETKLEVTLADDATLEITFGECLDCNVTSAKYATIYSCKNLVVPTGVKVFAPTYNEEKSVLTMNDAITEGEDKYVINADDCVDCGTCADACPAEAIHEGDGKYEIDADGDLSKIVTMDKLEVGKTYELIIILSVGPESADRYGHAIFLC